MNIEIDDSILSELRYLVLLYHAGDPTPPGGQHIGVRTGAITLPSIRKTLRPIVEWVETIEKGKE